MCSYVSSSITFPVGFFIFIFCFVIIAIVADSMKMIIKFYTEIELSNQSGLFLILQQPDVHSVSAEQQKQ